MQKLQLYISGERIDLFKDEQVSISLSQQDVKDPAKIFAEFTKTFTIPASKTNNKIFKHYYNFDISGGFDARNKVESNIELNNIPYKDGFVALNGVELKQNKAYAYKITFYGKTINLTKVFRSENLSQLAGVLPATIDYDDTNVKAKMQVAVPGSDVICPLITHTTQSFYDSSQTNTNANLYPSGTNGLFFKELKYAIKVKTVVDAIQTYYSDKGLPAFSDDFFNKSDTDNPAFNNLFLWLHRKKGNVVPTTETTTFDTQVGSNGTGFQLTSGTPPTETTMSGGTTLNIVPGLDNLLSNDLTLFVASGYTTRPYTIEIINGDGQFWTSGQVTNSQSYNKTDFVLDVGSYYINIISAQEIVFTNILWNIQGNIQQPLSPNGWTNVWESGNFTATTTFQFIFGAQMPSIKVIDFMTGLFKMFNLTAYYDNQALLVNGNTNPNYGKIRIQTLDDFFANNFNTWDISKYLDIEASQVNVGLPYNQISFGYEGVETFYAAQFTQLNNADWGGLKYEGAGEEQSSSFTAPNKPYTIAAPFEHLQYVRLDNQNGGTQVNIQTGWFVDDNRESYINKPLLFYPVRLTSSSTPASTSIAIRNNETGSSITNLTSYIIPSNSRSLFTTGTGGSTENINFKNENNEFNIGGSEEGLFTGTLFNNYYNTYISDVFNSKRRIFNFKAFLPLNMIYKLQMNDVIKINNQNYIINTANINLITGESSFELLNKV